MRFTSGSQIRFAHNLNQRNAAAVHVHERIRIQVVNRLARIFLHVNACDTNSLLATILRFDFYIPAGANRCLVLGNLVALWKIRIKVVFPGKHRPPSDGAVQCQTHPQDKFRKSDVKNRQTTRQAKTNRTHIGIGLIAKCSRTATECLRLRQHLRMDFKTDHGLIIFVQLHLRTRSRNERRILST